MAAIPELELDAYTNAALRSERLRMTWMLVAFGLFLLVGVFRTIVPLDDSERAGPVLIAFVIPYLVYEAFVRRLIARALGGGLAVPLLLSRLTPVIECSFPLLAMAVMIAIGVDPYLILVSSGYSLILLIMALSPLQLDPGRSMLTGATGTLGYLALVVYVLLTTDEPGPHPIAMYYTRVLVLGLATAAITFVTIQVRGYVVGTVRELETKRRNDAMHRDLELARDIQRGLLPDSTPSIPGYELAAMSRAAELAGGDYYDWQTIGDGRVVITLADVTGHGVGPALVTAACRAYVRATITNDPGPETIIARANHLLHGDLPAGRFVTFAIVDIDSATHEGIFLSAGHGPTLWVKGADGSASSIDAQGLPLGILGEQEWEEAYRLAFEPADVLVLFSDGYFETQNSEGVEFSMDRLRELVCASRTESAETILQRMDEALLAWQGDAPQQDDMTAVVIKRS